MKGFWSLALIAASNIALAADLPWLTGPLISPVGEAVYYGHFKSRNFLYVHAITLEWLRR